MARIDGSMPPLPSSVNSTVALQGLRNSSVRFGDIATDLVDGPSRFVDHLVNPVTTHNLQVVDMPLEGVAPKQIEMHEQSHVFVLKIDREDFADKHVCMTLWQLNVFLAQMHRQALQVYRDETKTSTTSALSQVNLSRLIKSNPRLEILMFLSTKFIFNTVNYIGVQFGNRFNNANTGPGIAIITSGSAEARNTCLNSITREQDELWVTLRSRSPGAPLAYELQSYGTLGGPLMGDRHFVDLANCNAWGPCRKIGHIADKYHEDIHSEHTRFVANGLRGTTQESHWAEASAPVHRIVLCTNGMKMFKV